MTKLALAIAILAAAPLAASADVTKEDIKKLSAAGVGEEVILTFIRANGPVARLSADDLVELKQAGATERVLAALAGGGPAPRAQVQVEKQVIEKPVYVPSTTYVYETPSYYPSYYPYYWPSYYYSGWCYPRYSYSYYTPRYGVGLRVSSGWCYPRATWSLSYRR